MVTQSSMSWMKRVEKEVDMLGPAVERYFINNIVVCPRITKSHLGKEFSKNTEPDGSVIQQRGRKSSDWVP